MAKPSMLCCAAASDTRFSRTSKSSNSSIFSWSVMVGSACISASNSCLLREVRTSGVMGKNGFLNIDHAHEPIEFLLDALFQLGVGERFLLDFNLVSEQTYLSHLAK